MKFRKTNSELARDDESAVRKMRTYGSRTTAMRSFFTRFFIGFAAGMIALGLLAVILLLTLA